jgi:hypothetical protein
LGIRGLQNPTSKQNLATHARSYYLAALERKKLTHLPLSTLSPLSISGTRLQQAFGKQFKFRLGLKRISPMPLQNPTYSLPGRQSPKKPLSFSLIPPPL